MRHGILYVWCIKLTNIDIRKIFYVIKRYYVLFSWMARKNFHPRVFLGIKSSFLSLVEHLNLLVRNCHGNNYLLKHFMSLLRENFVFQMVGNSFRVILNLGTLTWNWQRFRFIGWDRTVELNNVLYWWFAIWYLSELYWN